MPKSTTLTSAELIKRSEALRQQAEELKRKEIPAVVARMKDAIAHYGLSAADLGLGGVAAPAAKKRGKASAKRMGVKVGKRGPSVIKYRDADGHAWSGFGPRPKWFKEALAKGITEDALKA